MFVIYIYISYVFLFFNRETPQKHASKFSYLPLRLIFRKANDGVCGSVMFLQNKESDRPGDAEQKLIQAAASYLGKQMEL